MPSLPSVRQFNASYKPSYTPVYVAVGGTAGIGEAMIQTFAHYTNGRAHIVIIGKNRQAAERILDSLPIPEDSAANEDTSGSEKNAETKRPEYKREFIYCDVRLMKNVRTATDELMRRLRTINYLVLSAGVFSLRGWEETSEGIDEKMASRYYSRWVFIHDLIPLLKKAYGLGEEAGVMSVLGGGMGPMIDVNNFGLKKGFSGFNAMIQSGTYNDLMMAEYAKREPTIAFTHIYPGFVNTRALVPTNWLLRLIFIFLYPIIWMFATPPSICAEYMLYALLENKKGLSLRNQRGDDVGSPKYGNEEIEKKLWEHTEAVTGSDFEKPKRR